MTCPHCRAADATFGSKVAAADRKRYARRGPDQTTAEIVRAVRGLGLRGATLLDIGAGIGVVHHELLEDGIAAAVHVEPRRHLGRVSKRTRGPRHAGRSSGGRGRIDGLVGGCRRAEPWVCCPTTPPCSAVGRHAARRVLSYPEEWYVASSSGPRTWAPAGGWHSGLLCIRKGHRQALAGAGLRPAGARDLFVWRVEWYVR
jgi:hypothetical protein